MPKIIRADGLIAGDSNNVNYSDLKIIPDGNSFRLQVYNGVEWLDDQYQRTALKGLPNGYAPLDVTLKVPQGYLNAWTIVSKPTDTDRRNNTLDVDPHLQFVMNAATRYRIRARVLFESGLLADFKWRHTGPASPTLVYLRRQWVAPGGTALAGIANDDAYSDSDLAITPAVGAGEIEFSGVIVNGANAGNFSFSWSQNTTQVGVACIVRAGSYLEYQAVT